MFSQCNVSSEVDRHPRPRRTCDSTALSGNRLLFLVSSLVMLWGCSYEIGDLPAEQLGVQTSALNYRRSEHIDQGVFKSADWNGDGLKDELRISETGTRWFLRGANGALSTTPYYTRPTLKSGAVEYVVADFNGDRRSDMIIVTASGSYWYIAKPDGTFTPDVYVRSDLKKGLVSYVRGDWNGDGRTDLIVTTGFGAEWYLSKSDGALSDHWVVAQILPEYRLSNQGQSRVQFLTGDFNADARTDYVEVKSTGTRVFLAKTDGSGTFTASGFSDATVTLTGTNEIVLADVNGDHCTDMWVVSEIGQKVHFGALNGTIRRDAYVSDIPWWPGYAYLAALAYGDDDVLDFVAVEASEGSTYVVACYPNRFDGSCLRIH